MGQSTLTTFAGTVVLAVGKFIALIIFSNVFGFVSPLKMLVMTQQKFLFFIWQRTPLWLTLSKFRNLFLKNGQDNRHDLKSGLKNIRKFEGGLGAPQSA